MMPVILPLTKERSPCLQRIKVKLYGDTLSLGSSAFSKTVGTYANSELATSASLISTNSYDSSTTQNVGNYEDDISISSATGTGGFLESNYDISYISADLTNQYTTHRTYCRRSV